MDSKVMMVVRFRNSLTVASITYVQTDRRQSAGSATPSSVAGIDNQQPSEVEEHDPDAGEAAADEPLVNPLAPGESPAWTTDVQGRPGKPI